MATSCSIEKTLSNLQSKDHERILNVVDELRSQGISHYIDLPQIVVVGDQSSGKSATLEAISGLKFPTKDALCTRFGTELVLRHSSEVSSTCTIIPDPNRSEEEKTRLKLFKSEGNVFEKLDDIIQHAGQAMGLDGVTKNFSTDILRIELCGPSQPHLTLVDLPGVFHSGSKSQSEADADAVKSLVTSYIKKERSIILAVISAKNEFVNQIIARMVKDYGSPTRTMGLITKPDTLPRNSDSERQYFNLALNKDVAFDHGWHILKNRDFESRDWTNEQRDASEKEFFGKGIWTGLSPSQLGVDALRSRLSRILQAQIAKELPNLIKEVESGLLDSQSRIELLGAPRATLTEQRLYLHSVSDSFTNILREAVAGRYDGEYFGGSETREGYQKRIRAVVVAMLSKFKQEIEHKGQMYKIVDTPPSNPSAKAPYKVTKQQRLENIRTLIERNRGRELATVLKEETVTALFREQCSPWAKIVKAHAADIYSAVYNSVLLALEASCDQSTKDGLMGAVVGTRLADIKHEFDLAVDKILQPHQHGFPVTYNHYLTHNLQKARDAEDEERFANIITQFFGHDPRSSDYQTKEMVVDTQRLLQTLLKASEPDMMMFACKEALNTMEAYYKVAMKSFIDDFAKYVVEGELLVKLETLFAPNIMYSLPEDVVSDVCGETEESRIERAQSEKKLATLTKALEILTRLNRSNSRAKSYLLPSSRATAQASSYINPEGFSISLRSFSSRSTSVDGSSIGGTDNESITSKSTSPKSTPSPASKSKPISQPGQAKTSTNSSLEPSPKPVTTPAPGTSFFGGTGSNLFNQRSQGPVAAPSSGFGSSVFGQAPASSAAQPATPFGSNSSSGGGFNTGFSSFGSITTNSSLSQAKTPEKRTGLFGNNL